MYVVCLLLGKSIKRSHVQYNKLEKVYLIRLKACLYCAIFNLYRKGLSHILLHLPFLQEGFTKYYAIYLNILLVVSSCRVSLCEM